MSDDNILWCLPHLTLAMPFVVLAIALLLYYFTKPKDHPHPGE
jgi:hypothetical protein